MSSVIMRNRTVDGGPVTPPKRRDGTLYPYAMVYSGMDKIAFADSYADLVAVLMPAEYATMTSDEQFETRHSYALSHSAWVQALLISDMSDLYDAADPWEQETLMSPRVTQPAIRTWTSPMPLVLVTTGYAPHTDLPLPTPDGKGVILWLDPTTEISLLRTLAAVGIVQLAESTP